MISNPDPNLHGVTDAAKYFVDTQRSQKYDTYIHGHITGNSKFPNAPLGKICIIVKKYIKNALGSSDACYYYVMYDRAWFPGWATDDFAHIKKYEGTDGCTVHLDIYHHMNAFANDKQHSTCSLGRSSNR